MYHFKSITELVINHEVPSYSLFHILYYLNIYFIVNPKDKFKKEDEVNNQNTSQNNLTNEYFKTIDNK